MGGKRPRASPVPAPPSQRLHFSDATQSDILAKSRRARAAPVRFGVPMARNLLPILLGILAPLATGAWLLAH
jgi:hypothetical protein